MVQIAMLFVKYGHWKFSPFFQCQIHILASGFPNFQLLFLRRSVAFNDLYKSLLDSILEDGSVLIFCDVFLPKHFWYQTMSCFRRKGLGLVVLEVDDFQLAGGGLIWIFLE